MSQSLWNRAVSYDEIRLHEVFLMLSLNPFGTGQCLTTLVQKWMDVSGNVSIPLEQGSVLRLNFKNVSVYANVVSIPLEQGSVLRQLLQREPQYTSSVSIPLEQGSVLRHNECLLCRE